MITREIVLRELPPFVGKKILRKEDQAVSDIINEIKNAHNLFSGHYDKISSLFWKGSPVETARYIFRFLKKNVLYSIEPDTHQSVKSPAAILATGKYKAGMNDCKHYSLFIGGLLDSLKRAGKKIDWCYRFANYRLGNKEPGHVFVVLFDRGKEYWIDPVLPTFNNKRSYINKIDKFFYMPLYQISGADNLTYVSGAIGKRKRGAGGKKKPRGLKKILLKVAGAPSRNAFLLLVKLNVKKMATTMYNKSRKDPAYREKLKDKWERLGGKWSALESAFTKAAKRKEAKLAKKGKGAMSGNNIGAIQLAAALAAAVPVIAALAQLLGKGGKEAADDGAGIVQDIRDTAVSQSQLQPQDYPQQQNPAYMQPQQQPVVYYTPQPQYYPQQQYYSNGQPMYAPVMQTMPDVPQYTGIQVRPAASIEGIGGNCGVGNYKVVISGIGTDKETMEIKEVEPKSKPGLLIPLLLIGGTLIATKQIRV